MRKLDDVLLESRIRADNLLSAVKLGFFGVDKNEIIKNVREFNASNAVIIDQKCEEIKNIIQAKGRAARD
jgi:hypothetical protein